MTARCEVSLGMVRETLLIPLHGSPVENPGPDSVSRAARAEEIVAAINYDFARFDDLPGSVGSVPRTSLFGRRVPDLPTCHSGNAVAEPGAGPNTRYERIGNGNACWFELVLPDVIDVRRSFSSGTPRRTMIDLSVTDPFWSEAVASSPTALYFFTAEAVLPFLTEDDVRERVHRNRRAVSRVLAGPGHGRPGNRRSPGRARHAQQARGARRARGLCRSGPEHRSVSGSRGVRCPAVSRGCRRP